MEDRYIFYVEPYVFLTNNNSESLLFNTLNSKSVIFNHSSLPVKVKELFNIVIPHSNKLYVEIDKLEYQNIISSDFFVKIRDDFYGDAVMIDPRKPLPAFFTKVPTIDEKKALGTTDNPKYYLNEVFINIQGSDFFSNDYKYASNQFNFPFNYTCSTTNAVVLKSIISSFSKYSVENLHLNMFDIEQIKRLDAILVDIARPYFNIHFHTLLDEYSKMSSLISSLKLVPKTINIYIHDIDSNKSVIDFFLNRYYNNNLSLFFIVESSNDYEYCENLINEYNISNYQFYPFYNNRNKEFFNEFVTYKKQDVLNQKINHINCKVNSLFNANFFGIIKINADGHVYLSYNKPSIGNILQLNNFDSVLNKMLISDNSLWRMTRKKIVPCKNCILNELCPPISEYELHFGQFNLCEKLNIKKL